MLAPEPVDELYETEHGLIISEEPVAGRTPFLMRATADQIVSQVCDGIENGNTIKTACDIAGISQATLELWAKVGRKAAVDLESGKTTLKPYEVCCLRFLRRVHRAESRAISRNVLFVQAAARDSWQAASWFLERRRPTEWGKPDQNVNHHLSGQVSHHHSGRLIHEVIGDERLAMLDRLADRVGLRRVDTSRIIDTTAVALPAPPEEPIEQSVPAPSDPVLAWMVDEALTAWLDGEALNEPHDAHTRNGHP